MRGSERMEVGRKCGYRRVGHLEKIKTQFCNFQKCFTRYGRGQNPLFLEFSLIDYKAWFFGLGERG